MPAAAAKKERTPAQIAASEKTAADLRAFHAWRAAQEGGAEAPVTPVATAPINARRPTIRDQRLLNMNKKLAIRQITESPEMAKLREVAEATGMGVQANSNEPPKFILYDDWSVARFINANNYEEVMKGIDKDGHRLHDVCPNCGGEHPESEGNPNACPAREAMTAFQCPEVTCGKICWPDVRTAGLERVESDDPNVKQWDISGEAIKRMAETNFRAHVGTYHPSLAQALGIPLNPLTGATLSQAAVGAR